MNTYNPDSWVLIKFYSEDYPEGVPKVFAGWYGGYLGSDSWKLSSGVESVVDKGDYYEFKNCSGSIYNCHKQSQQMSGYMSDIFSGWKTEEAKSEGKIRIDIETNIVTDVTYIEP